MVVDEKSLGRRLQAARQAAGLTQQQLCQKSGLSYSTLAKIERGAIKAPSIFTIQQIASVLGTSLDELIGHTPSPSLGKKRSKSGVSFVYVDVNGCLVRFFHRAFTKIADETGALPDKIETAFWHYNDAVCTGEISVAEFNKAIAKNLGLKEFDWQKYYLEAVSPIKEMHELAAWVDDHYGLGLLTNIMPGFVDKLFERGLLPKLNYDSIVDSSKVGAIKPSAKIYEVAQTQAKCSAEEILFIDDSRTNLMAAERLGWHVLWFDDFNPSESVKRIKTALEPAD